MHGHGESAAKSPVIGIDLGTTNSLVAVVADGRPRVLRSPEGERLLPSVVTFGPGEPVIGYAAKRARATSPDATVFSAKRLLGRGFDDLDPENEPLPYSIERDEGGLPRIVAAGRRYTAIEVSALILAELKRGAEKELGVPVTRAVITVPAYFNDSQRQATRAAGRLAGLEVLRIVNEPTAASLAYGLQEKKNGVIAVYDLGGGTFDVSILRLHDGIFEVLATHGDTRLGGDDLDRLIADRMAAEIRAAHGLDAYGSPTRTGAMLEAAERTKIALASAERAPFAVEWVDGASAEARAGTEATATFTREWTRAEFDALARPLLARTGESCRIALRDAGLAVADVTDVVLVGGPTRLPAVKAMAEEIFGRPANASVHPDEVVALGAAIQADILAGHNRDLLLLDVVPLSLGIETYGGLMETLIRRNTRIPASARETFTTFVDGQTGVDVHVLQGEREQAAENRSLARFKLGGLPPGPAGLPRVEVTFLIDADGILQVEARDARSGREASVEVRPSFGLAEREIEAMLEAARAKREDDLDFKRWIEVRNGAEPVLRATEKKLPDAFRLLPRAEAEAIERACARLREAIARRSPEEVQNSKYELDALTVPLAEKVLAETLRARGNAEG